MYRPRERILNTASVLFHRQGYNNTGINQIIEDSGVSKASFYHHFKSKDDLCIEFLHRRYDYWVSELVNFTSGTADPKDKLLKSFDFLMYMNEKENFRGCSFLNLLSDVSEEKTAVHEVIRGHKNSLRESFSSGIGDEILAAHIYLLFESSIITSQLYRSNELIEKSKIIVHDLLKQLH